MEPEVAQAFVGQVLDNRYRLVRLLGGGAFGCVFETEHHLDGHVLARVAVKVILKKTDGARAQIDELQHSIRLNHPNLIRCHTSGEGALELNARPVPVLYVVMELADETLENRLRDGRLGARDARAFATDIAAGLAYLRQEQVAHRDVKPSNVLCVGGRWKLGDLGLVTPLATGRTEDLPAAGTFVYIAPEVHEGQTSPASDVWSFGVMLLEAVTGQLPFDYATRGEWLYHLRQSPVQIPPGIPEPLNAVIRSALVKDRSQRIDPAGIMAVLGAAPADNRVHDRTVVVVAQEGGDFTSVREAVDAVAPGSRIVVRPGTFAGTVTLKKPVELVGVGVAADIVLDGLDGAALIIDTGDARVSGLTLLSSKPRPGLSGVVEIRSGQSLMELCSVAAMDVPCLYVRGAGARPIIRRCRFHRGRPHAVLFDCDAEGVLDTCAIFRPLGTGLVVRDGANPTVRRCQVWVPKDRGLWIGEKGRGAMEDCVIQGGSGAAIEMSRHSQPLLRRVKAIAGNGVGIKASSGARGIVVDCQIDAPDDRKWQMANGHQVQRL